MESHHPDERPAKKRRFFTEDSSPAQPRPKRPSSPPTPPPVVEADAPAHVETNGVKEAVESDGFDVGMLQAVVGELSAPTLQKLKDVSGNNVERGLYRHGMKVMHVLTYSSNQPLPRRLMEYCAAPADRSSVQTSPSDAIKHHQHAQAQRL